MRERRGVPCILMIMNTPTYGAPKWDGELPNDPKYDAELLQNGDTRNVEDRFRYMSVDAIKAELDTSRHEFHVAIENWQHDLNIGTIVRTANAFNASAVHVVGKRHWNRRGAMVTDRYMNVFHHPDVASFVVATRDFSHVAIDNVSGATPLHSSTIPKKCVFIFGGEGPGLSQEMLDAADQTIAIEQFGSTRSVNVGVAAGIVMYAWVSKHVLVS